MTKQWTSPKSPWHAIAASISLMDVSGTEELHGMESLTTGRSAGSYTNFVRVHTETFDWTLELAYWTSPKTVVEDHKMASSPVTSARTKCIASSDDCLDVSQGIVIGVTPADVRNEELDFDENDVIALFRKNNY